MAATSRGAVDRALLEQVRQVFNPPPLAQHIPLDPEEAAEAADLRYVSDDTPGLRRRRAGKGFVYLGKDGAVVQDRRTIDRIRHLAIPPAWDQVWIAPTANAHLQATGRDEKGRKQYLYHPRWREVRDQAKFEKMIAFGEALPRIREGVAGDLRRRNHTREKVLAAVVRLLELTLVRVGNDEYRKSNKSFGLTTLRKRHVAVRGSTLRLRFRGKGGRIHEIEAFAPRAAKVVRACQELPGQELFQYVDAGGEVRSIDSADVNAYLKQLAGEEFTAKDFRTWFGTLAAARALCISPEVTSQRGIAAAIKQAIHGAAQALGNTPSVCRKSYIHPGVLEAYRDGRLGPFMKEQMERVEAIPGLSREERALLTLLRALREEQANLSSAA